MDRATPIRALVSFRPNPFNPLWILRNTSSSGRYVVPCSFDFASLFSTDNNTCKFSERKKSFKMLSVSMVDNQEPHFSLVLSLSFSSKRSPSSPCLHCVRWKSLKDKDVFRHLAARESIIKINQRIYLYPSGDQPASRTAKRRTAIDSSFRCRGSSRSFSASCSAACVDSHQHLRLYAPGR